MKSKTTAKGRNVHVQLRIDSKTIQGKTPPNQHGRQFKRKIGKKFEQALYTKRYQNG